MSWEKYIYTSQGVNYGKGWERIIKVEKFLTESQITALNNEQQVNFSDLNKGWASIRMVEIEYEFIGGIKIERFLPNNVVIGVTNVSDNVSNNPQFFIGECAIAIDRTNGTIQIGHNNTVQWNPDDKTIVANSLKVVIKDIRIVY